MWTTDRATDRVATMEIPAVSAARNRRRVSRPHEHPDSTTYLVLGFSCPIRDNETKELAALAEVNQRAKIPPTGSTRRHFSFWHDVALLPRSRSDDTFVRVLTCLPACSTWQSSCCSPRK